MLVPLVSAPLQLPWLGGGVVLPMMFFPLCICVSAATMDEWCWPLSVSVSLYLLVIPEMLAPLCIYVSAATMAGWWGGTTSDVGPSLYLRLYSYYGWVVEWYNR